MRFSNPYMSKALMIGTLQRHILVHSFLYYEMDTSVISDVEFDDISRQLVKMQNKFPEEAKRSQYWYVFSDFDGSTGFDLYHRLNKEDKRRIMQVAWRVLKLYKKGG